MPSNALLVDVIIRPELHSIRKIAANEIEARSCIDFLREVGFAGITGDFGVVHVNEQVMHKSFYGRRIAHGVLIVGFMSATSTRIGPSSNSDEVPVSLGYDRIRFLKPAFIGDTITIHYEINEVDAERGRTTAAVSAVNQHGETVAIAEHILR